MLKRGEAIAQRTSNEPTMIPATRPMVARPRARSVMYPTPSSSNVPDRPAAVPCPPVKATSRSAALSGARPRIGTRTVIASSDPKAYCPNDRP